MKIDLWNANEVHFWGEYLRFSFITLKCDIGIYFQLEKAQSINIIDFKIIFNPQDRRIYLTLFNLWKDYEKQDNSSDSKP